MQKKNDDSKQSIEGKYEYELPGNPIKKNDETIGESFFSNPSPISPDVKPYNPNQRIDKKMLRSWYIATAIVLVLGLIFEFGILGKDGKEGALCRYLPQNIVCQAMAGAPPSK